MHIIEDASLLKYNTFGIEAQAAAIVMVENSQDLTLAAAYAHKRQLPIQFLGGGSNVLFLKDKYACVFVKNVILGKKIIADDATHAVVRFGGGENWHDSVMWAMEQGLGGIENLALIPGTVGAAPIQNIGAYGVELKDVFEQAIVHDWRDLAHGEAPPQSRLHRDCKYFSAKNMAFGYRDSFFKRAEKNRYFITHVDLKLTKAPYHSPKIAYGDIQKTLAEQQISTPTIRDVGNAVIAIRQSKLPDPSVLGNAGSFFKNPVVATAHFDTLKQQHPTIVGYPVAGDATQTKVAAGWLIEQCGWKGHRVGNAGVHARQALVLVNFGGAKGSDIAHLAIQIQESVATKFHISLEAEVNFL